MTRAELIQDIRQKAILVNATQQQPYTFYRLHYVYQAESYFGVGFSKMRPGDTWNDKLGVVKARGRAVSDIYRQIVAARVGELCNSG